MVRKTLVLLCALSLSVFVVACGSDDKSDTGSTSTPAATTAATTADTGSTDTGSAPTADATDPAIAAAIKQCKATVDSNPAVKDDIKPDLEKICDKAATGDAGSAAAITKEVCLKVVDSSIPAGDARDMAEKSCNAAGG
jgi:hypothetical protein